MINVAHFMAITPKDSSTYYFQNYFYGNNQSFPIPGTSSPSYLFAPFSVQGATAQLNGDNETLVVLLPFSSFALRLVENGNGNRLSKLELKTVWLETNASTSNHSDYFVSAQYVQYFSGVGATYSESTIELRFKSAMDAVNAMLPGLTFSKTNAGTLPLNADINLR